MVETEAAFQLNAQYFYYERGREVDFVDEDWALECKMKKRIRRQELRTLLSLPQPKKCVLT
ncbi:MAG: hypothetical protein GXN92_03780 [Candidatus Micrarchaeota archaeon]|nr:hypothetical protein [Candidatus Micrarchaeota archaeon]